MLAFYLEETGVKNLMNKLMRENDFDSFEIRSASVSSFVGFEISGMLSKEAVTAQPNGSTRLYALWGELKPFVFSFIKGKVKPASIKIVFSGGAELNKLIHPNAAALFLNMIYENDLLHFTTATSQKEFSLNKELDMKWEEYITGFFKKIDIPIKFE